MGACVLLCREDCLLIFTSRCEEEEWEGEEEREEDK